MFRNEVDLVPKEYFTTRLGGTFRGRPPLVLIAIAEPLLFIPAIKVRANSDRTPPGTGDSSEMVRRRGAGATQ